MIMGTLKWTHISTYITANEVECARGNTSAASPPTSKMIQSRGFFFGCSALKTCLGKDERPDLDPFYKHGDQPQGPRTAAHCMNDPMMMH